MTPGDMRVQYHGPSGEWDTTWPPGTIIPKKARFKGIWYTYAGQADGAVHFREEVCETPNREVLRTPDCQACEREALSEYPVGDPVRFFQRMIVCPTCGNKRCPMASDHRLPCSGSNEPGQAGSVYR